MTVNIDGKEISGYIDYADKLSKQDWGPIFRGKLNDLMREIVIKFN